MSDIKSLARANSGVEDAFLFDLTHNPFRPLEGWGATTMFIMDWQQIERPVVNQDQGGQSSFTITRNHDQLGFIRLKFTISAPTATGSTYCRLHDYAGIFAWSSVEIWYGSTLVQTIRSEDMMERLMDMKEREIRCIEKFVGGNLSNAQRDLLAASSQSFETEIPVFWTEDIRYFFPTCATAQELEIRVNWRDCKQVIQTDGTLPSYSITSQQLLLTHLHLNPKDKADLMAATKTGNGIMYKNIQHTRQRFMLAAPDQEQELELTACRGAVNGLKVYVRKQSEVDSNTGGSDPWNLLRVDNIKLNMNNTDVFPFLTHDELVYEWYPKWDHGECGRNFYSLTHGLDPNNRIHNTNSLNYGFLGRRLLTLKWDDSSRYYPSGVPIRVDAVALENNIIQLHETDIHIMFK